MKVIDTTLLIHILRKKPEARDWLTNNLDEELITTDINVYELFIGAHTQKIRHNQNRFGEIDSLLQNLRIISFDTKAAYHAAEIAARLQSEGIEIGTRDQLIAGIALANEIKIIVTRNEKHFNRIVEIEVETY